MLHLMSHHEGAVDEATALAVLPVPAVLDRQNLTDTEIIEVSVAVPPVTLWGNELMYPVASTDSTSVQPSYNQLWTSLVACLGAMH